jgi:hypothetical protein
MRETEPPRLVWCVGMYASGSTWLFNAARAVAAVLYPERRVAGHYAETMKGLRHLPPALNIVKTHDLGPAAATVLAKRAERILVSLRDPRDAVTSMMQHMGQSFPEALARVETSAQFAARHAGDPRASLFLYESGFTDAEASFDRLAEALGGALTPAQRQALFTATRRDRIEEKISRLAELPTAWRNPATGDLLDRDTQWHRHHAGRSGESGRWRRMLPPPEVAQIEQRMAGYMREFGYLTEMS